MKLKHLKTYLFASIAAFAFASCSVVTESTELSLETQTFTFEDIFEGPNSATVEVDLKPLMEANENLKGKEIEGASIKSIVLMKEDSLGFSEISSAKLQVMADGEETPMVAAGVNTSIDGSSKEVTLDIMDEVELEEYLKEEKIYLILDGNFAEDSDEYVDVKAKIIFSIDTEKKE